MEALELKPLPDLPPLVGVTLSDVHYDIRREVRERLAAGDGWSTATAAGLLIREDEGGWPSGPFAAALAWVRALTREQVEALWRLGRADADMLSFRVEELRYAYDPTDHERLAIDREALAAVDTIIRGKGFVRDLHYELEALDRQAGKLPRRHFRSRLLKRVWRFERDVWWASNPSRTRAR